MSYFEKTKDGYIISFGESSEPIDTEITEERFNAIKQVVSEKPVAEEGKGYRLKTDLTWEEYDLPVIDEGSEEVTAKEIAQAIAEVFDDEE